MVIRVAVMGLGKIARDGHLPAIARSDDFELVATASSRGEDAGVPTFASLADLVASGIEVDAMSLCMPPMARFDLAREAIDTGDIGEYDDIYRRFAALLASGESDADGRPLALVSDCLMLGRRVEVEAFT